MDLYQAYRERKGKNVEINFINDPDPEDITHLDIFDFFEGSDGKINHLIDDGNIHLN